MPAWLRGWVGMAADKYTVMDSTKIIRGHHPDFPARKALVEIAVRRGRWHEWTNAIYEDKDGLDHKAHIDDIRNSSIENLQMGVTGNPASSSNSFDGNNWRTGADINGKQVYGQYEPGSETFILVVANAASLEEISNSTRTKIAVGQDEGKLKNIGWSGRRDPAELLPPGAPRTLEIKREGKGWVYLDWKTPAEGGTVSAYRVLTRTSGDTEWNEIVLSFESMTVLTDQPQGVDIEFQVIAINKAGASIPSNLVTVDL